MITMWRQRVRCTQFSCSLWSYHHTSRACFLCTYVRRFWKVLLQKVLTNASVFYRAVALRAARTLSQFTKLAKLMKMNFYRVQWRQKRMRSWILHVINQSSSCLKTLMTHWRTNQCQKYYKVSKATIPLTAKHLINNKTSRSLTCFNQQSSSIKDETSKTRANFQCWIKALWTKQQLSKRRNCGICQLHSSTSIELKHW